jgi:hypothetical protein
MCNTTCFRSSSFRIALLLMLLLLAMMSSNNIPAESLPGVELAIAGASTTRTSEGKEFYIAFGPELQSLGPPTLRLLLSISSAHEQAQITIELPGGGNSSLQVAADGSAMYILPSITLRQMNSNVSEPLVIKVSSMSTMFTLSGLLSEGGSAESYLALPLEALGTEYIVPSMPGRFDRGYIQIVTTDAQLVTNITFTTRVATSSGPAGTYQLELGPRMAWLMTAAIPSVDLGGTKITGSAPFGVIAGHQCTQVPVGE